MCRASFVIRFIVSLPITAIAGSVRKRLAAFPRRKREYGFYRNQKPSRYKLPHYELMSVMIESILIFLFCIALLIGIVMLAVVICTAMDRQRHKHVWGKVRKRIERLDMDAFEAQHGLHLSDELRELYRNKKLLLHSDFFFPQPDYETTRHVWYIQHFLPLDEQTMRECRAIIAQGHFPFASCGENEYYAVMLSPCLATNNPVCFFRGKNKREAQEADSLKVFFSRLQDAIPPLDPTTIDDTK